MLNLPSIEELTHLFEYDDSKGVLIWKTWNRRIPKGVEAGSVKSNGYSQIRINGKIYLTHRLIWKIHYKTDPLLEVDHIDHDKLNNRISNLRELSHKDNCLNRRTCHATE